jgi:hypothetical protein
MKCNQMYSNPTTTHNCMISTAGIASSKSWPYGVMPNRKGGNVSAQIAFFIPPELTWKQAWTVVPRPGCDLIEIIPFKN